MTEHEARASVSPLAAGVLGHCPACGRGKLFSGYLTLAPRCTYCGLDYHFADSGDGPAVFVILVTGFIVVGAALIVEILYQPPYWIHAVLWGSLAILLPLLLLRSFKGALIGLQYKHKAEEGRLASE
jgi:cytochrome c oxidase subunit III